jgi:hypothetical protein
VRWVVLLVLAGCGRLGFTVELGDAARDSALDGANDIDAPTGEDLLLWFEFDGSVANRGSVQSEISCDPTCPSTVAGKRIAAGGFDGATMAVRIADRPELHVTAGTIAMWMRPTALPLEGEARSLAGAAFGTASLNSWEAYFYGAFGGEVHLITGGDAGGGPSLRFTWDRGVGTWFHVASAWDGSTTHRMYLDGIEVASGAQFALIYDDRDVMIGVDDTPFGNMHYFAGDIDDLRFYNRALTQQEIAALATP